MDRLFRVVLYSSGRRVKWLRPRRLPQRANRIRKAHYRVLQLHSNVNTAGNKIMTNRGSNLVPQRGQLPARLSLWSAIRCFNSPIHYKPNRKLASMVSASSPFTLLHQVTLCYALPGFPLRWPSPANFGSLIIGPTLKWAEIVSMDWFLWLIS